MSIAISRIGDISIGICNYGIPHPIVCTLISCSALTPADGLGIGRIGDLYTTTCPTHNPIAVSTGGSTLTTDTGLGLARVGDLVTHAFGTAVLVQGSPIVTSA